MGNIFDIIKSFGARMAIAKSSRWTLDRGLEAVYTKSIDEIKYNFANGERTILTKITPQEAARYYIMKWATDQNTKLYALLQGDRDSDLSFAAVHTGVSELKQTDKDVITGYYATTEHSAKDTSRFNTSRAIMATILLNNIEKAETENKKIIGYTIDETFAQEWQSAEPFKIAPISNEEARDKWETFTDTQKREFLKGSFSDMEIGAKIEIINYIVSHGNPFKRGNSETLYNVAIDSKCHVSHSATQALLSNPDLIEKLSETSTKGLVLAGPTAVSQLKVIAGIILVERALGIDFTSKFISGDAWLGPEEMNRKAKSTDADATIEYAGEQINLSRGLDLWRSQRDREQPSPRRAMYEQQAAIGAQTNAVLDAQIAQLQVQIENTDRDFRYNRITATEKSEKVETLRKQIRELESKKQKIHYSDLD